LPLSGHGGAAFLTLTATGLGVAVGRAVAGGFAVAGGRAVAVAAGTGVVTGRTGAFVGATVAAGSGVGVGTTATIGGSEATGAGSEATGSEPRGAETVGATDGSREGVPGGSVGSGTVEVGDAVAGFGSVVGLAVVAAGVADARATRSAGGVGATTPAVSATVARMRLRTPMATTRRAR
jgi:hypothetical protein